MKKSIFLLSLLLGATLQAGEILMGTTTSLDDTGFLTEISQNLKKETGIDLKWIAKGTGEALELGKRGDVDILFTHDPGREIKFIEDGYGVNRYPLMHNYFVVVSNSEKDLSGYPRNLKELLSKIATENSVFISRGDKSGTHSKELSMWKEAKIDKNFKNYKEAGLGMAKTLNLTSELQGFTLSDSGTFLKVKDNFKLQEVPLDEKEPLKNIYSILELSNVKESKKEDIKTFIKFMQSKEAEEIMKKFGEAEFGTPLFYVGY